MGIPGLLKHVERFEHGTFLGCENVWGRCFRFAKQIVIDGPSLAYFILQGFGKGVAQPLYSQIRDRLLEFLTRLERYGATITAIYFDGFLPEEKRLERLKRLKKEFKQAFALQRANPDGIKATGNTDRAPALPFLVPVVIESLASSRYKDRTCVVPGEADIYCASYVQQHGGIVLSTDLDLIVHDLGIGGAFSFFKGIRSSRCKRCKGACLFATKSLKPYQIAQQLGVSHVSRFAFELLRDPQVTLDDAIQRAQQPIQPKSDDKYERFRNTYPSFSNSPLPTTWDLSADLLDPRISEFIVQVESLSEKTIYYYLPVLLDDPIGSSAWVCGTDLRLFSYSVMLPRHTARNLQIEILEHQRCGEDVNAIRVELMDQTTCNAFAKRINSRIQSISRLQAGSMTAASWRVFGAVQVLLTYTEEQPNLPKGQILEQLLNELYKGDLQSWAGMCVYARLQAVLYSLRQVKQILGRLRDLTAPISELARELQSLPRLEVLIPGYDEISDSFDIGSIQQPVESAFGNLALTDSTLVTTKSKSKLVERGEELGTTEGKRKYASREGETDTRPVKMRW